MRLIKALDKYRTFLTVNSIFMGGDETYAGIARRIERLLESENEIAYNLFYQRINRSGKEVLTTDSLLDGIVEAINHLDAEQAKKITNRKEVTK